MVPYIASKSFLWGLIRVFKSEMGQFVGPLRVAKSTVKVRRLSLFSSFRVIDQIMGSFPHSLIFRILPHRRQQRWGPRIIRHCPSASQQIGFDCWREK